MLLHRPGSSLRQKKVIAEKKFDVARSYMDHVVDQAVTILKHRKVSAVFTTPKLLEALPKNWISGNSGIRGVFMVAQPWIRSIPVSWWRSLLENRIGFYPTYGNTLMGLAASIPITKEDLYSITYYSPQPRAVLRVVDPQQTDQLKDYGEWGRVELTTLTKEFFMPRFLERDEAIRKEPRSPYPWDGVAEVRPFGAMEKKIVEGVY